MVIRNEKFDSYHLKYFSNLDDTPCCAHIGFYDEQKFVASIFFHKDGIELPSNVYISSDKSIRLHYPISRFNDIITILRIEKQLAISIDTKTENGYIGTYGKPVDKKELKTGI
ncbi:hypothetical protein ACFL96_19325 [Thermoproteota archaeon]